MRLLTRIIGLLPARATRALVELAMWARRLGLTTFSRNGFSASLYYALFSREFRRENRAVLLGRLEYWRSQGRMGESSFLLRRNVHRLEKGLIARPRRAVFGQAYIGETVECYARALTAPEWSIDERRWATDVLDSYFDTVETDPAVQVARERFRSLVPVSGGGARSIPYTRGSPPPLDLGYEQLVQLFRQRRSVRCYQPTPVPTELLRKAVNAATLAPSACNRQPYQFVVVNDPARAPEVARCAMGTTTFADNVPCVLAVVGDLSAYPLERDRHVIYIDAALAAMSFMLALETLGLSSCPVNWPDIEDRERELARLLGLEFHQRAVLLITVGYADPDGGIAFSQKKSDRLLMKEVGPVEGSRGRKT